MSQQTPGTAGPDAGASRARRRTLFRTLGVVCMATAVLLIALAAIDFFTAFNDPSLDGGPTRFWMFFAGVPFFAAGGLFLGLGFSGATARYVAGEYSPAIQSVARDLGLRDQTGASSGPYCRSCGQRNDADARFCDRCGTSMSA